MHLTSRKPSVDFVQGAFLELLINSDLSFKLQLEQKVPMNCLLERKDVFFFSRVRSPHNTDRTQEEFRGEYLNSVVLVICPLIGVIEDQMKEGQPLGLTCSSLQDVNNPFNDNSWPQLLHQHIRRESTR